MSQCMTCSFSINIKIWNLRAYSAPDEGKGLFSPSKCPAPNCDVTSTICMADLCKSQRPLVTVASLTSFLTPTACQHSVKTGRSITVHVSDSFWSNTCAISSRLRQKGLQYAVEGYIQNIKISNKGDTTTVKAKAYRSMAKLEKPHGLYSRRPEISKAQWNGLNLTWTAILFICVFSVNFDPKNQ